MKKKWLMWLVLGVVVLDVLGLSSMVACTPQNEDVGSVDQALGSGGGSLPGPQVCDQVSASPVEEPLPGEVFVAESTTQPYSGGERIVVASDTDEFGAQLCHKQLLTTGSDYKEWFIQCGLFQTLLWEGPTKLLLVDAGGHNSGLPPVVNGQVQPGGAELQKLLAAIAEVAPNKPIRGLVPSHPHQDHAGNLLLIKAMNPLARVIVGKWFLREVQQHSYSMATPVIEVPSWMGLDGLTTVVHERDGGFTFDGHQFELHTPVAVAHTAADQVVITPGHSCMVVDILQPGRLAFVDMSVVQSIDGMIMMLRYLGGLAEAGICQQGVWGHFNVSNGPKVAEDISRAKGYLLDLHMAFWAALGSLQAEGKFGPTFFPPNLEDDGDPSDPHDYHAHVGISRFFDEVALRMHFVLAPTYGSQIGFSASRGHIREVLQENFLFRLGPTVDPNQPPPIPDFTNIPAGTLPYDRHW